MVIGYCGRVPRGTGIHPEAIAQTEADQLGDCAIIGALVDMRDLRQVLAAFARSENRDWTGPRAASA
jgi:hypothetical protein